MSRVATPRRLRVAAAIFALLALPIATNHEMRVFEVLGPSMEPTLRCAHERYCTSRTGDRIMVSALAYQLGKPQRGDVVAFRAHRGRCGAGVLVKRIVGLPGDSVDLHGHVLLNNGGSLSTRIRVPAGHYFVLGDNRRISCDSREFGPVPASALLGKVILILRDGWRPAEVPPDRKSSKQSARHGDQ
jgi:signal peptidase I